MTPSTTLIERLRERRMEIDNEAAAEIERLTRELTDYKRLEAILVDREDVRDGPDGEQRPNEAMSILTEWRGM